MSEAQNNQTSSDTRMGTAGLVVAILAVLVTVYFSLRSERTKEITITYLSMRPLVSLESKKSSVGLEVTLGGKRIGSPWLLSARVENSGNQPIEERDIEAPTKLVFTGGQVVGAEVVLKSQVAIAARVSFEKNEVTIDHKLLNPTDWVTFDVLFDGEPQLPPVANLRVSGVSAAKQRNLLGGVQQFHPTAVPIPTPLTYLLLTLGSLLGIAGVGLGLGLVVSAVRDVFRKSKTDSNRSATSEYFERRFSPERIVRDTRPQSREGRILLAAIAERVEVGWLDNPDELRAAINRNVPPQLLESIQMNVDQAVRALHSELRKSLQTRLSNYIFGSLPSGPDKIGMEQMNAIDVTNMTVEDIIGRGKEIVVAISGEARAAPDNKLDLSQVSAGIIIVIFGSALILVLGGTWRTLLVI